MATVTRAVLSDAVQREIGLSQRDARVLVDDMIETICARLEAGEPVMISRFGTFTVHEKGARVGRNPRTGEEAPILARRVVTFRASAKLKKQVATGLAGEIDGAKAGRVRGHRGHHSKGETGPWTGNHRT